MKQYSYATSGTCSTMINLTIDGDVLKDVEFVGGCPGNTFGVSQLVRGMKVNDVIARLEGIKCGYKPTSCPDQLTRALRAAMEQEA